MKKCNSCGAENADNARFCGDCGCSFDDTQSYVQVNSNSTNQAQDNFFSSNDNNNGQDYNNNGQNYNNGGYNNGGYNNGGYNNGGYNNGGYNNAQHNNDDAPSFGFAFLCFLFPIVGLILYLVWKEEYPLKAKSCGKGALISVILNVVFFVCAFILAFVAAASGSSSVVSGTVVNFLSLIG